MEFENKKTISDEDRRLAEAKKITIAPLHADITPESTTGSDAVAAEIATRHTPNVSNDSEDTVQNHLVQPSKSILDKPTDSKTRQIKIQPATASALGIGLISACVIVSLWLVAR